MRSRWHTDSVAVKTMVLQCLFYYSSVAWSTFLTYILSEAVIDGVFQKQSWREGILNNASKCIISFIDILAYLIVVYLYIMKRDNNVEKLSDLRRNLALFYFWLVFINFYIVPRVCEILALIGLLSLSVQSFAVVEILRIRWLLAGFVRNPDPAYFNFVMAASVCTAYYFFGYGTTYFWIVLSTCVTLNFLHGNFFMPSDAAATAAATEEDGNTHFMPSSCIDIILEDVW